MVSSSLSVAPSSSREVMASAVRRGPSGHPGLATGPTRPVLPEHIQKKLDERHGMDRKKGATPPDTPNGDDSFAGGSMAQRLAARRQQRSAERTAGLGGKGIEVMRIEDSAVGPAAWHGLGLRDDTIDPQRVWQEQMMQQKQKQMETQMQREQKMMEERILEREKMKLEQHRARVEARRSAPARKESSAQALGVQSHLKIPAHAPPAVEAA